MTRRDLLEMILMVPAGVIFVVGLWAFCSLLFALGAPESPR